MKTTTTPPKTLRGYSNVSAPKDLLTQIEYLSFRQYAYLLTEQTIR
ncbi:MAG: hypothetical protein ACK5KP_12700 [Paludibacteraceae bacterium]